MKLASVSPMLATTGCPRHDQWPLPRRCWAKHDGPPFAGNYFYGSHAGSANVSQFGETSIGTPTLVGVAASTDSGATDSAIASETRYLYVESGGTGAVDEFRIGTNGSLSLVGRITGLSASMEGIAAS
jgi:hypothetical protein